ncbi:MAG TPA: hypothetical protein DIV79_01650 [Opitutae bacterium]|nr:hypothetical protein [Opitutaceae bacterium]HCR28706.1 hypothetical protein [Opitutae bacterium]
MGNHIIWYVRWTSVPLNRISRETCRSAIRLWGLSFTKKQLIPRVFFRRQAHLGENDAHFYLLDTF